MTRGDGEHGHADADHHPSVDGEVLGDRDEIRSLAAALVLAVGAVHDTGSESML